MKIINLDCHRHYTTTDKITADAGKIVKQRLANIVHIQVRF
jgi:hypothetical protein